MFQNVKIKNLSLKMSYPNYGKSWSRYVEDVEPLQDHEEFEFVEVESPLQVYDACIMYIAAEHDLGLYAAKQVVNFVWYNSDNKHLTDNQKCGLTIKSAKRIIQEYEIRGRYDR